MEGDERTCVVVGAGLVGSLAAIAMRKEGWAVRVLERRGDPRAEAVSEGKSINLSMSTRGLVALDRFGVGAGARAIGTPMHARGVHPPGRRDEHAPLAVQPYGTEPGDCNLSISRKLLNDLLIDEAERLGAVFDFGARVEAAVPRACEVSLQGGTAVRGDLVLACDGAFSRVRLAMVQSTGFDYSQEYLDHAYKELTILGRDGRFQMNPDMLHIWARGSFMLIALPNLDFSFTVTLFMPVAEFERLDAAGDAAVDAFFRAHFPDAVALMPDFIRQYAENPTGRLVTVRCNPHHQGRTVLLGDAAHAIVPFYGQGMNCGFEDVCWLVDALRAGAARGASLEDVVADYSRARKPNTDAIAQLSMRNYLEMRDHVNHASYLLRKKLDLVLHRALPSLWCPLYSMVTYSSIPYAEVLRRHQWQDAVVRRALFLSAGLACAAGCAAALVLALGGGRVRWR